jgi:hypothetical protein
LPSPLWSTHARPPSAPRSVGPLTIVFASPFGVHSVQNSCWLVGVGATGRQKSLSPSPSKSAHAAPASTPHSSGSEMKFCPKPVPVESVQPMRASAPPLPIRRQ